MSYTNPADEEAIYKRLWINEHNNADELVSDAKTKMPVAAIYYYPPTHHEAENKKLWRIIETTMELEELQVERDKLKDLV